MYYVDRQAQCLFEGTQRDFAAAEAKAQIGAVRRVHFTEAHAWVLSGRCHSTSLYRGIDGRIARAG